MAGLDNILKQIREDAEASAAKTVAEAQKQADDLLEQARREAAEKSAQAAEHTKAMAQDVEARAQSATDLEKRKRILAEKQALISGMIEQAQASLEQLPDAEYFSVILKLVQKYALPQDGEILFSEKDFARIPSSFEASLAKAVPAPGKLRAGKSDGVHGGGFLLSYGGIEENCTFQALFDAAREDLQDKVHALIFS